MYESYLGSRKKRVRRSRDEDIQYPSFKFIIDLSPINHEYYIHLRSHSSGGTEYLQKTELYSMYMYMH